MKIDGTAIAKNLAKNLQKTIVLLKQKNITPHLAIVLVGDDPASVAYVNRKEKKAIELGALCTVHRLPKDIAMSDLEALIEKLNRDPLVHGIIVQRPLPKQIDSEKISRLTNPQKDIDGFHPQTPFAMPLGEAVITILNNVFKLARGGAGGSLRPDNAESFERSETRRALAGSMSRSSFGEDWEGKPATGPGALNNWLKEKNIVIIGKGPTGGMPTISLLKKMGMAPAVIDSKTTNKDQLIENADIIISAVGRSGVIDVTRLKKGVILVSVGLHKEDDGKMHGDYEEDDVKDIASFYTPTPGGVGPVNVISLLQNLVTASENK